MSLCPDMWNPLVQPSPILWKFPLGSLRKKKKPLTDSLWWSEAVPLYFSLKCFEIFRVGGITLLWGYMVTLEDELKHNSFKHWCLRWQRSGYKQWFTGLWKLHCSASFCLQGLVVRDLSLLCFQSSGHTTCDTEHPVQSTLWTAALLPPAASSLQGGCRAFSLYCCLIAFPIADPSPSGSQDGFSHWNQTEGLVPPFHAHTSQHPARTDRYVCQSYSICFIFCIYLSLHWISKQRAVWRSDFLQL